MSNLYIVATPIGNLEDITFRAISVLKSVDLILCEDTRVTKKLLARYEIQKPTMSYHTHSKLTKIDKIFELLNQGKNLALVSDAGTPGISDPGAMLVAQIKGRSLRELPQGPSFGIKAIPIPGASSARQDLAVRVIPIPGASAVVTALSACGLPTHEFTFLGFLPHKKGRETLFKEIAVSERTMVFYESPHRILKTLESLVKFCPLKKVCIARELTKIYEEFKTGTPAEVLEYLNTNKEKQRGEFTVIVA